MRKKIFNRSLAVVLSICLSLSCSNFAAAEVIYENTEESVSTTENDSVSDTVEEDQSLVDFEGEKEPSLTDSEMFVEEVEDDDLVEIDGEAEEVGLKQSERYESRYESADGKFEYRILEDGTAEITDSFEDVELGESVIIPSMVDGMAVTSISGDYSVSDDIYIPESVTNIGFINSGAITVAPNNPVYSSVDGVLFNKDKTKLLLYPSFEYKHVYKVPSFVTSIGTRAFIENCSLLNLIIFDNVKNIEADAMPTNLDEIICEPNSYAETYAKKNNRSYLPLYNGFTYMLKSDGTAKITGYYYDKTDVTVPAMIGNVKVTSLERGVFSGNESLKKVTISEGITTIYGDCYGSTFDRCRNLEKVILPDTLTYIGAWTFRECSSLKSIVLPKKLKYIGGGAFMGCTALKTITLPKSLNEIEPYVGTEDGYFYCNIFNGCKNLTEILIEPGNTTFSSEKGILFSQKGTKLEIYPEGKTASSYKIPDGVKYIASSAFSGNNLKSIEVPKSVVNIGACAFGYAKNLESVKILNPKCTFYHSDKWGKYVIWPFEDGYGSKKLTVYGYAGSTTEKLIKEHNAQYNVNNVKFVLISSITKKKDFKKATVSLSKTSYIYDGKSKMPTVTVTYSGKKLSKDKDYSVTYKNNKAVGTASVIVTGKGEYSGTITKTFKILPKKDIKKATVSLSKTSYIYDGKSKTPTVTVTYSGKKLSKDKDYSVTYKNNKAVGTASVIVTGKGAYSGTITKTFKIQSNKVTITFDANGGTVEMKSKTVTYKGIYGSLPTPMRKNYRFTGWYTQKKDGKKIEESTIVDLSLKLVYAHWIKLNSRYIYQSFPEEMTSKVYSILKNGEISAVELSNDGWYYVFYYDNGKEKNEVWIKTTAFSQMNNSYNKANEMLTKAINGYNTGSATMIYKTRSADNKWGFIKLKVEAAPSNQGVAITVQLEDYFSLIKRADIRFEEIQYPIYPVLPNEDKSEDSIYKYKIERSQSSVSISPSVLFGFSEKNNKIYTYELKGTGTAPSDKLENTAKFVKVITSVVSVLATKDLSFGSIAGIFSDFNEFFRKENKYYETKMCILPSKENESYYGITCKSLYELEQKGDYFQVNIGLKEDISQTGESSGIAVMFD